MRVEWLDNLRGLAILTMIFWQVYDFFSTKSIYKDAPLYLTTINAPTHFYIITIFWSVSGAVLYLSWTKRKNVKHLIKRYGGLILLSLPFTTTLFGPCTFIEWGEALQGIGIAGLITGLILTQTTHPIPLILIGGTLLTTHYSLRTKPPQCTIQSFIPNAVINGFFTIYNLTPLMITGVILIQQWQKNKKNYFKKTMITGTTLILISIILTTKHPYNFYSRTPPILILEIGLATILFGVFSKMKNKTLTTLLKPFGQHALKNYVAHFLIVYAPLKIIGKLHTTNPLTAITIATIYITLNYYAITRK